MYNICMLSFSPFAAPPYLNPSSFTLSNTSVRIRYVFMLRDLVGDSCSHSMETTLKREIEITGGFSGVCSRTLANRAARSFFQTRIPQLWNSGLTN